MHELARKFFQPIPILIIGICMFIGLLIASIQKASGWDALTYIFGCIFMGLLFAYGYSTQKHNIFFWALIGIGIEILITIVKGKDAVLITDLALQMSTGAFIGLLVEDNLRGVRIGALIGALAFGGFALFASVSLDEVEMNRFLGVGISIILGAWRGALFGGLFSNSSRSAKQMKQKKMLQT